MEKLVSGEGVAFAHVLRAPLCIMTDDGRSGLLIHRLKLSLYPEFQRHMNHRIGLILILNGVRRLCNKMMKIVDFEVMRI